MAQRKLIRPDLTEVREQFPIGLGRRKSSPQERTNAEAYYYIKQMNQRTAMSVVLVDGEEIEGWIEWYDKDCIKLNRQDKPNLLVMKHQIKYISKQSTGRNGNGRRKNGNHGGRRRSRAKE